jgi:alanine or glycine:cation symporter, AGCS family
MESFLKALDNFIWSGPLLFMLFFVGIYLTIKLRGVQFRYLGYSLKLAFTRHDDKAQGDISHFQSLMTALAATIGIGSITGVATAIAAGGLGALFWMWIVAFLGMATKYAEAILAIKFREKDAKGQMCGGPMYYLEKGLKVKWLGVFFAIAAVIASFGIGNIVQAHSISSASVYLWHVPSWLIGAVLSVLTLSALFGGIQRIGKIASFLVPIMGVLYILGGLFVIFMKIEQLPEVISLIFTTAFTGQAATGGFVGSTIMLAIQYGVSRGIFSSESGLGSAPIAAAAAKTDVPSRQALVSMSGVFITSFIVCSITGFVIALTNTLGTTGNNGQLLDGSLLVYQSFESVFKGGGIFVTISLVLFGYSTILGWAYYGEKSIEYLLGLKAVRSYRIVFSLFLIPGAMMSLNLVWSFANIANAFMGFPNLIGLLGLATIVSKETRSFDRLHKKEIYRA